MGRGRPMIGTPEEAAARRRAKTAERVQRLRERRRAERAVSAPAAAPAHQEPSPTTAPVAPAAAALLRSLVERIERFEEAKRYASPDDKQALKKLYAEAKADGFDVKALREVIRLRQLPKVERQELEIRTNLYKQLLGMA